MMQDYVRNQKPLYNPMQFSATGQSTV